MIRATCSSRQADARRVRRPRAFSSVAIPRSVQRLARRSRIAVSTACSRVGLQVLAIRSEPEPVSDIADALAIGFLVIHRIPRPLADGFALPLTHGCNDV